MSLVLLQDAWMAEDPVEKGAGSGELASAQDSLSEAESKGQISTASWWQSLVQVQYSTCWTFAPPARAAAYEYLHRAAICVLNVSLTLPLH